jgi:hypothetical protein
MHLDTTTLNFKAKNKNDGRETTKEVCTQSVAENTAAALGHLKKSDMSVFRL